MPDALIGGLRANVARNAQDRDSNLNVRIRGKAPRLLLIQLVTSHEIDVDRQLSGDVGIHELRQFSGLFEVGDAASPIAIRGLPEYGTEPNAYYEPPIPPHAFGANDDISDEPRVHIDCPRALFAEVVDGVLTTLHNKMERKKVVNPDGSLDGQGLKRNV